MFPQIGCLLDDMIGVIEKFQAFRCKGDAVAVPFEDGDMEFFFEFFNGRTQAGLAIKRASAAAEMELCFDNSTM